MPRISDAFLSCAVYFYLLRQHAEEGRSIGGAGFLVGVPEGSPEPLTSDHAILHHGSAYGRAGHFPHHLYAVTNRHVGRSCGFARLNRRDGTVEILKIESEQWLFHESSDLAVALIEWSPTWEETFGVAVIPHSMFLSPDEISSLEVGPGDDTFTVGRFVGHDGRERNLPVAWLGNIAMLPLEPVEFEDEGLQNVFLIESRTVQGYSGSPVFLNIPPWELRESPRNTLRQTLARGLGGPGDRLGYIRYYTRLLGVVAATLPDQNGENTGMMAAVPAWELLELLNYPEIQKQRQAEREK